MNTPKRKAQHTSLAEWRAAHGLTLKEAGAALGYSESGYFKLERGERHPHGAALKRCLKVTRVPLDVLAGVA